MLLKCILFTAVLLTASCLTMEKHKGTFLKGSSTTHDDVVTRHTEWASDGTGDINYLAAHSLNCVSSQAGALSRFQLRRNDQDQISFAYQCLPVTNINYKSCSESHTEWFGNGADSISAHLISGQNVQCDAYSVLGAVQLETTTDSEGTKARYTFTCCGASTGACDSTRTDAQPLAQGNLANLDALAVAGPSGSVLTGFSFTADGNEEDSSLVGSYRVHYCASEQAVTTRQTSSQTHGDNDIIYLDRQNVDCQAGKAGAISRFQLQRQGSGNVNYKYECTNAQSINWDKCVSKSNGFTDLADDHKKSLQFLDRQNVQCDEGSVLTQFKLQTSGNQKQVRYNYSCCEAVLDQCLTQTTSTQDIEWGYLVYLDRQNVKAQSDGVMTGFQFQAQYPRGHGQQMTGNYKVKSCIAK